MHLPENLTAAEIRILQEFRRLRTREMSTEAIQTIKHPALPKRDPVIGLIERGYVEQVGNAVVLTAKSDEFLSVDPVPIYEREG